MRHSRQASLGNWTGRAMWHAPRPASLAFIQARAALMHETPGVIRLWAGTPVGKAAPDGMGEILGRSSAGGLGVAGGLTLIKSAAAFTPPSFSTTTSHQRTGAQVLHFATVNPTTSSDVEHESFFPLPGDHERPGMSRQIQGRTVRHYWRISATVSDLIREGEQEHLDDASRAYELTYKRVEMAINGLTGQRFGPARTPAAATQLAQEALERILPVALGTNPAHWVQQLDLLLARSKVRDDNGWHALSIDPPITSGDKVIHPVSTTPSTRVGSVSSHDHVVL